MAKAEEEILIYTTESIHTIYFRTACNYFCINGKKNCESQNIHIKRKG